MMNEFTKETSTDISKLFFIQLIFSVKYHCVCQLLISAIKSITCDLLRIDMLMMITMTMIITTNNI